MTTYAEDMAAAKLDYDASEVRRVGNQVYMGHRRSELGGRKPDPTPECTHGHPMTPANIYRTPAGKVRCRSCNTRDQYLHRVRVKARARRVMLDAEFAGADVLGRANDARRAELGLA